MQNIEVAAGKVIKAAFGQNALELIKAIRFLGPYRLFKSWREINSRQVPQNFPRTLSICAIMKNEGPYLQEWIEYHHLAGVEKFYLYDNGSTDRTQDIIKPYVTSGLVEYTYFPIDKPQIPAYKDCIDRHMMDSEWLAFIDLDEFIVPVQSMSIKDSLPSSATISQIVINWLIFGSNGQTKRLPGYVMERFTKRGTRHWLSKTIVNPRKIHKIGVHEHIVSGRTLHPGIDQIRINHYHCKSWEEYQLKAAKGDVLFGRENGPLKYARKCFDEHDLNDISDLTILKFLNALNAQINSSRLTQNK